MTIEIEVTGNCDLNCVYCFEKTQYCDDTKNIQYDLSDLYTFINVIKKELSGPISIGFWGGEPTLKMDTVSNIVNTIVGDSYKIYTNGNNVDNIKQLHALACNAPKKWDIQVSYDGSTIQSIKRKTIGGLCSNDTVLQNIDFLYKNNTGYKFYLKSTLPFDCFKYLEDTWLEFNTMFDKYGFKYLPTIDYHTKEDINVYFETLKSNIIKICKRELVFFKKHKTFLFNWFNSEKTQDKIICAVGTSLICVDIHGDVYVCHGALYNKDKTHHKIGSIYDPNEVLENIKKHREYDRTLPHTCRQCTALNCQLCNVKKYIDSTNILYSEKLHDRSVDSVQCRIFKLFGIYNRALIEECDNYGMYMC